jgi:CheY-like chemotaxis protein
MAHAATLAAAEKFTVLVVDDDVSGLAFWLVARLGCISVPWWSWRGVGALMHSLQVTVCKVLQRWLGEAGYKTLVSNTGAEGALVLSWMLACCA